MSSLREAGRPTQFSAFEEGFGKDHLQDLAGDQLLLLVTTSNINAVVKDRANTGNGIVLFATSTGKQLSLENPTWHMVNLPLGYRCVRWTTSGGQARSPVARPAWSSESGCN